MFDTAQHVTEQPVLVMRHSLETVCSTETVPFSAPGSAS